MNLLGNVETGWFATLAHGVEWVGRHTLNLAGRGWGDKVCGTIKNVATQQMEDINQHAIGQALSKGATEIQALKAGTATLEKIAAPGTLGELESLIGCGSSINLNTVKTLVLPSFTPLLIGAGVLGGIYLLADAFCGHASSPVACPKRGHSVTH